MKTYRIFGQNRDCRGLPRSASMFLSETAFVRIRAFLAVCFGLVAPLALKAQDAPARYGDIPRDSVAVASLEVSQMRESKAFAAWPWEIFDVLCREQFGFQLNDIETIDASVLMPTNQPEFGLSIRTSKPMDIAELSEKLATPTESAPGESSLRFRDILEYPFLRLAQKDPQRMLMGTQGTLRRMLSTRTQFGGEFVSLVQKSPSMLRAAINTERLRDLITSVVLSQQQMLPPEMIEDIMRVIELTDNLMIEIRPDAPNPLHVTFGTSGAADTELLAKSLTRIRVEGLALARSTVESAIENDPSMSDDMRSAARKYSDRMVGMVTDESFWSVENDRIVLRTEASTMSSYQTIGVMTGLLLPAVQAAREAARRMSSSNNIKQILLAMLNYEAAYKKLPPRAITDADGNPLLSWRVTILPFIEENALYNEFHLDEPWDSEHNIKLLDRMPAIYHHPSHPPSKNMSSYLAPDGKGIGLNKKGLRFSDITDGTSNTIAVVEVAANRVVPWTKPDDLDVETNPVESWMAPQGANVGFFDGSVRIFPRLPDELIAPYFTINEGTIPPPLP